MVFFFLTGSVFGLRRKYICHHQFLRMKRCQVTWWDGLLSEIMGGVSPADSWDRFHWEQTRIYLQIQLFTFHISLVFRSNFSQFISFSLPTKSRQLGQIPLRGQFLDPNFHILNFYWFSVKMICRASAIWELAKRIHDEKLKSYLLHIVVFLTKMKMLAKIETPLSLLCLKIRWEIIPSTAAGWRSHFAS